MITKEELVKIREQVRDSQKISDIKIFCDKIEPLIDERICTALRYSKTSAIFVYVPGLYPFVSDSENIVDAIKTKYIDAGYDIDTKYEDGSIRVLISWDNF